MLNEVNNRFVRFLLVGCVNTIIGFFIIFLLLNIFNAGYFISTIAGYSVGSIISFLLNRYYTFKHQGYLFYSYLKYFIIFAISYIFSYYSGKECMNLLIANGILLKERFITIENVGVICGMVVYVIINYFGNSLYTFKNSK